MSHYRHPDQQKIRHCCECGCELYADQDGPMCDECQAEADDKEEDDECC